MSDIKLGLFHNFKICFAEKNWKRMPNEMALSKSAFYTGAHVFPVDQYIFL